MDIHDQDSALKPRRQASTQYILLDSQDRNQNGRQAWNNFSFQKPQAILDAFANRILVSEVNFAWFIPNVTRFNNTLFIDGNRVGIPAKFYTPTELAAQVQVALIAASDAGCTCTYDPITMRYTITAGAVPLTFGFHRDNTDIVNFYTTASLYKTLGFQEQQSDVPTGAFIPPGQSLIGLATLSDYTPYIDIISNRLMRYTSVKDGESASNAQSAVICRVYASDETSTTNIVAGVPLTCAPFLIHRQFKNAKAVQWNKDSFVDYFDIQVIDQYNNLVPLPSFELAGLPGIPVEGSYPDWQITLLASED